LNTTNMLMNGSPLDQIYTGGHVGRGAPGGEQPARYVHRRPGESSSEHSVNIQWTFSEHSVNIQWTFSEHSVNIQSTFSEHSVNNLAGVLAVAAFKQPGPAHVVAASAPMHWTFSEHSVNIQWTFSEHSVNIQWTFSEHSVNNLAGVLAVAAFAQPGPAHVVASSAPMQWTFIQHSVNIRWTFSEHSVNIQWTFSEQSGRGPRSRRL
jgi:hypothetical protein